MLLKQYGKFPLACVSLLIMATFVSGAPGDENEPALDYNFPVIPETDSGAIVMSKNLDFLLSDRKEIEAAFPLLRNVADSVLTNAKFSDQIFAQPLRFKPSPFGYSNKRLFKIDKPGHALLLLMNIEGEILYVINLGQLSAKAHIYHFPNELLTEDNVGLYFLCVILNNKIYAKTEISYPGTIPAASIDIYNSQGKDRFFSELDSTIAFPGGVKLPEDIFPNCTLVSIPPEENSSKARPDWNFYIPEDSTLASLLLPDKDQELVRLFFHTTLSKGEYALYFARIDEEFKPLEEGEYYFLLRLGSQERIVKFRLVE
jgi:hypothetical protein